MIDKRPLIFGHRGAPLLAPENTIESIQKALELGADGIEIDVMVLRDGTPILAHGKPFSFYLPPKSDQQCFLTLRSVFEFLQGTTLPILLDVKYQIGVAKRAATQIASLLMGIPLKNPFIVTSYSPFLLLELKRRLPDIERFVTIGRTLVDRLQVYTMFPKLVPSAAVAVRLLQPWLIDRIRSGGGEIYVWTVNTPQDVKKSLELGVDGIITDDIPMVQQSLKNLMGS